MPVATWCAINPQQCQGTVPVWLIVVLGVIVVSTVLVAIWAIRRG